MLRHALARFLISVRGACRLGAPMGRKKMKCQFLGKSLKRELTLGDCDGLSIKGK
jgi:hypothetical protein